jgi:hypothetical protein
VRFLLMFHLDKPKPTGPTGKFIRSYREMDEGCMLVFL